MSSRDAVVAGRILARTQGSIVGDPAANTMFFTAAGIFSGGMVALAFSWPVYIGMIVGGLGGWNFGRLDS